MQCFPKKIVEQVTKTYNTRDSRVVTHSITGISCSVLAGGAHCSKLFIKKNPLVLICIFVSQRPTNSKHLFCGCSRLCKKFSSLQSNVVVSWSNCLFMDEPSIYKSTSSFMKKKKLVAVLISSWAPHASVIGDYAYFCRPFATNNAALIANNLLPCHCIAMHFQRIVMHFLRPHLASTLTCLIRHAKQTIFQAPFRIIFLSPSEIIYHHIASPFKVCPISYPTDHLFFFLSAPLLTATIHTFSLLIGHDPT